jgi:polyhydroxyalkanoate synthesis regulator phasin
MKISKIDTNHLRNDAHFQFQSDFRDAVAKFGADTLKVKPQFDEWTRLYVREDEALKKILKSALTQQIHEADKARDNTYLGMVEICTAYLRHHDHETAEAARRLKIIFDTYGNVAKKPIKEQTSAVHNILQELQGKYEADCATIKIDSWVSRLAIENDAVNKLMGDRYDESASKCDIVMKEARKAVDEVYRNICEIINVYVLLEGLAAYEEFIRTLNAVIAKYAVKRHHGHGHERLNPDLQDLKDSQDAG